MLASGGLIRNPALLIAVCVASGRLFDLSECQFSHLQHASAMALASWGLAGIHWDKVLNRVNDRGFNKWPFISPFL